MMEVIYNSNSLCHHGIKGMKWGRRKQRVSSGKVRTRKNIEKTQKAHKKILTDARKQKLKTVGKTALKVAGAVAATTILGYAGSMAYNYAINNTPLGNQVGYSSYIGNQLNAPNRSGITIQNRRGESISGPVNLSTLNGGAYANAAQRAWERKH